MVVLTSRDEKRGVEAFDGLNSNGLSENVIFHQLDVTDTASVASLANFIQIHFGKLDILVNNAAISGVDLDPELRKGFKTGYDEIFGEKAKETKEILKQTYEGAESCLRTNYYGVKRIANEKAKELGDVETLTEEKVDEIVKGFLEDVKANSVETKGWPTIYPAYTVSKAASNAYTRILAKKLYQKIAINAVSPGHVKTDLNYQSGVLSVEEGAKGPVRLALMTDEGKTGLFFDQMEECTF
ncbi:hypothetical protein LguiA_034277 [Lonicera macranthoides]